MADTLTVETPREKISVPIPRFHFAGLLAPYLVTVVLTLIFYAPWFQTGAMFSMGDYYDYFVPSRGYATTQLRQGNLPEWTHDILGGFPFLSDPQTAVFYPGNLLLAALTDNAARTVIMDRLVLAHVLLLALGAVFLARSLGIGAFGAVAAAVVITFNGYPIMHLGHVSIIEVMAVGMWVLGCTARAMLHVSRRWAVLAAMLLASCVFVGHPQTTLFLCYALAAGGGAIVLRDLCRYRSRARFLKQAGLGLLIVGLAAICSMIQILPTGEMLEVTKRSFGDMTLEIALTGYYPARELYGLLFPRLYSPIIWRLPAEKWHGIYTDWGSQWSWEFLFHIGVFAFALGLFGYFRNLRRPLVHVLFFCTMFVVAASLGEQGKVYPFLYKFAPGFQDLRIPPRMMWVAWTAWALLVGLGVEALREAAVTRARRLAGWAACLVLLSVVLFAVGVFLNTQSRTGETISALKQLLVHNPEFNFSKRSPADFVSDIRHQVIFGGTAVIFCCVLFLLPLLRTSRLHLAAAVAVAAIFLELTIYGFGKNISKGHEIKRGRVSFYRALPEKIPGRVLPKDIPSWRLPNMALVNDYENASAYTGFFINCTVPFIPDPEAGFGRRDYEKLMDIYNVSHVVTPRREFEVEVNGRKIAVPDVPWVELAAGDSNRAPVLKFEGTTESAHRVHVVSTAASALLMEQGSEIGILSLKDSSGQEHTTYPLRMGIETAEWNMISTDPKIQPGHDPAREAFVKPLITGLNPNGLFYISSFDVPSTASLASVEVKVTASAPTYLCISHLLVQSGDNLDIQTAAEAVSVKQIASHEPPNMRPEWQVYERSSSLGYAWMVPFAEAIERTDYLDTARARFRDGTFDPARAVLLNTRHMGPKHIADRNAPAPNNFRATAKYSRDGAETLLISTEANQKGWLVVSNTFYPGWRAYVDGQKTRLIQANGAHMAVAVPAGKHNVTLQFTTPKLETGAIWSGFGWITALGLLLYPSRRRIGGV